MIDLTKLQTFLLAAQYLNFTKAAKHLNITQPTVSHHIGALEQVFDVELFDRSGADIKLTEAGRLLLPWACKLVNGSVELKQIMTSLRQQVTGHIRIACSTTTGKYILPLFAARFRQQHPAVPVSILRCAPEYVALRLLDSEANLGVVSSDVSATQLQTECQEFFVDHIILIASANHPWASRQYIEPTELLESPFIIREPTSGTRRVMLNQLGKHDISLDDMDILLEIGNTEAIVKTVEAGFGVSFVSHLAAAWALEQGSVVKIPVAKFHLRRNIYMVRQTCQAANRAAETFWGFVHDPANADLLKLAER
jgi:DNA-binding transcriptional LysR family regulator